MTAYDARGARVWDRRDLGATDLAAYRNGRLIVPIFGEFPCAYG
jgi:hypothetical protein